MAYAINQVIPAVSALTIAVVLGVLARNTRMLGRRTLSGAGLATKKLLRIGVVFLGLQLSVGQILTLPVGVVLVVVLTVAVTFAATLLLG